MRYRWTITCLAAVILLETSFLFGEITGPPEPARVEFYRKLLPDLPRGVGAPISDRKAWEEIAGRSADVRRIVADAEAALEKPMPEMTDDLYLDYTRTGNRNRGQAVLGERHGRLRSLVLAECLANEGRYLPAIEATIRALAAEKSWLMPAHDSSLRNFKGETVEIDLAVAGFGWQFATAKYWLGEKLSPEVRKLMADELERRVFAPFTGMVNDGKPRRWWLNMINNWNAVCLAGVTGAALAELESRERRAFFAAAAEKYVESFLNSFTSDGYCSEGVGYWNYGFGHFIMLAETLKQASGGKVDWMAEKRIEPIALFGRRMEILPGIYPSFADCDEDDRPDVTFMAYLSRRYGWGLPEREQSAGRRSAMRKDSLFEVGLFAFSNSLARVRPVEKPPEWTLRDWFSDAGILICRPSAADRHALGAALKGGHNAENHNHNDVGSFIVALGKSKPLTDPGAEVYTARTFSSRRYESNVLNSFGHSVPRVAGQLQTPGRQSQAKILKADFSAAGDTLKMDISAPYPVGSLKKLERTFVFSRAGAGRLTVIDEVEFDRPESFGTALMTHEKWERRGPSGLSIGEGADAVLVEIAVEGGEFRLDPQEIHEDVHGNRLPVRLGIELTKPVVKAKITTVIDPVSKK
ncbi:MAG: heparinase II/III family protein [Pirellulales bacterium]|nr:heparinase II/III family protein [Pirellulales bacterium]